MTTVIEVAPAPVKEDFITVKTTLPARPFPPTESRPSVTTERLLLRPLRADDVTALHELRTQEDVMKWTYIGRIDRDMEETRGKLSHYLPPKDVNNYQFAICLKATGEMIGIGGCHVMEAEFGWPELGYMFRKEHWGGGLATEFVRAFMPVWAGLPRAEAEVKVDPRTATGDGVSEEQLVAITANLNVKSQAVLRKSGWELFITWKGGRTLEDPGDTVVPLPTFRFFPGRKANVEV